MQAVRQRRLLRQQTGAEQEEHLLELLKLSQGTEEEQLLVPWELSGILPGTPPATQDVAAIELQSPPSLLTK